MAVAILFAFLLCASILVRLFGFTPNRRHTVLAQDMVVSSLTELQNVLVCADHVQAAKFTDPNLVQLQTTILLQVMYLHDTLGMVAATALNEPSPLIDQIARFAFSPAYNWTDYVNRISEGLSFARGLSSTFKEEVQKMNDLLLESAHAIMPLRQKLAVELGKAGIVWKS